MSLSYYDYINTRIDNIYIKIDDRYIINDYIDIPESRENEDENFEEDFEEEHENENLSHEIAETLLTSLDEKLQTKIKEEI